MNIRDSINNQDGAEKTFRELHRTMKTLKELDSDPLRQRGWDSLRDELHTLEERTDKTYNALINLADSIPTGLWYLDEATTLHFWACDQWVSLPGVRPNISVDRDHGPRLQPWYPRSSIRSPALFNGLLPYPRG